MEQKLSNGFDEISQDELELLTGGIDKTLLVLGVIAWKTVILSIPLPAGLGW